MEKFTTLTANAAFLPIANIDTDMIIAKQYLKTIKRTGLGKWLFAALRYDDLGSPRADFVLNQKPEAHILLAGENFGCGSSREHAPWSLLDFGIRAVIAPSFADIFFFNAFNNGMIVIRITKDKIDALAQNNGPLTIDLPAQTVTDGKKTYRFEIEPNIKTILTEGLDAIEGILRHKAEIDAFEDARFTQQPWLR